MEPFIAKLKEKLVDKLAGILVAVIPGSVILVISILLPVESIRNIDAVLLFWMNVCFLIICTGLFTYIITKRPRYKFIPEYGILEEIKSRTYYCTSCHSNGKRSPLKENENGWFCMNKECGKIYFKHGKEPKPASASSERHVINRGLSGWVNRW